MEDPETDNEPTHEAVRGEREATAGKKTAREEAERIHTRLSNVYHDLNNSLSVISGNAQFLAEMARAEGLDPAFVEALGDIEAARAEISEAIAHLDDIRKTTEAAGQ